MLIPPARILPGLGNGNRPAAILMFIGCGLLDLIDPAIDYGLPFNRRHARAIGFVIHAFYALGLLASTDLAGRPKAIRSLHGQPVLHAISAGLT